MSKKSIRKFSPIPLALVLAGGLSVAALADDHRLDEAWKDAIGDQEPILTTQQFAKLNNLAYQAAVTKVCDGYELDDAKFSQGFTDATTVPDTPMTDDERRHWEAAVLIRFGTTYGLLLAEGNAEPNTFCASATELKADTEVPNVWK